MPNSQVDTSVKSFTAGEDLAIYRLVKLTSGTLNYADAGEDSIGVTQSSCDSGEQCAVKLWNSQGTFKIESAGAVTTETAVYVANDGKVDDAVSGSIIGVSIEAASAAAEYIEIRKGEPTDIHVKSATVSDPAAAASPTTSGTAAPTAYSAHASGAVAVTSNAATDLDTTAAALATLVTEVTAYENELSDVVTDIAALKTAIDANKTAIDALIDAMQATGLMT